VKEAAKFFRRYPTEVMATKRWEKSKYEDPFALVEIQEYVYGREKSKYEDPFALVEIQEYVYGHK
jgi:hypothetical protein